MQKIRYTHDAMIDTIIANPAISQGELAALFGYSQSWVSVVLNSDAFRERLAARRAELVDPAIVASVEERLRGLANLSAQITTEHLAATRDPQLALKALSVATKALGYGAPAPAQQAVQVNVSPVVVVPAKEGSSEEWQRRWAPNPEPALT